MATRTIWIQQIRTIRLVAQLVPYGNRTLHRNCVAILVPALLEKTEIAFYVATGVAYGFDLVLEGLYSYETRSSEHDLRHREIAISWIGIDAIALSLIGLIISLRSRPPVITENVAAIGTLMIVLLLTFWDYFRNRDLYFGLPLNEANVERQ